MAGVITDACIKCKHMECVEVCPVDAFYEGENMLVINPDECVDCGCCIDECPIDAIVFDTEARAEPWLELNAKYSKLWPNVTYNGGQCPDDADKFRFVTGKFELYFSSNPGDGDINPPIKPIEARSCGNCNGKTGAVRRTVIAIGFLALIIGLLLVTLVVLGMILFSFNPNH